MYTILGATGNVGSKIADILVSVQGEDVRLVSRTADRMLPCLLRKTRADLTYYSGDAESYVGDILDTDFLVQAFKGSEAVFTLIPPNTKTENFMTYADKISESITRALEIAEIKYVVNLSSIGAELSEGTGPVLGLYNFEQRLNRIKNLNVMHVRAAFFMENLFMNIEQIGSKGINSSPIRGDLKLPMIATQDIADFVVKQLVKRDFSGSSVAYLLGERDLSMSEATAVIGKIIGKPDLKYVMLPYDEAEKALLSAGFSRDVSRSYVELDKALNDGRITGSLKRTEENTTAISIERFCSEVFAQIYSQKKAA
jgi:uncharacterized protein YbjT (DUF2867 family)